MVDRRQDCERSERSGLPPNGVVKHSSGSILASMIEESPSRLVLVRHGQSRSNLEEWISSQSTCGGLTELGRAEAAAARDRLAQLPDLAPDAVVVSTMRRAIETAAIVAEPTGMQAEQRSELLIEDRQLSQARDVILRYLRETSPAEPKAWRALADVRQRLGDSAGSHEALARWFEALNELERAESQLQLALRHVPIGSQDELRLRATLDGMRTRIAQQE